MPTTSPRTFSSGPPELPGLMAASVCSIGCSRPATPLPGSVRPSAEITPTVTVCPRPNGLPMATTQSPCCICDESPKRASCSGSAGISVSWISALSVSASRPMTLAAYSSLRPAPTNETLMFTAPSTTWLFVRM